MRKTPPGAIFFTEAGHGALNIAHRYALAKLGKLALRLAWGAAPSGDDVRKNHRFSIARAPS